MIILPYLHFDGQCEAAFRQYAEIFGGKVDNISRYGDTPPGVFPQLTDAQRGQAMHAHLTLPGGAISGSDSLDPSEVSKNVCMHAMMDSKEEAIRVFFALAEGGAVQSEIAPNPPPDDNGGSGLVTDRFGIDWIVTTPWTHE